MTEWNRIVPKGVIDGLAIKKRENERTVKKTEKKKHDRLGGSKYRSREVSYKGEVTRAEK